MRSLLTALILLLILRRTIGRREVVVTGQFSVLKGSFSQWSALAQTLSEHFLSLEALTDLSFAALPLVAAAESVQHSEAFPVTAAHF